MRMYGIFACRSSISNVLGCSLVRQRMAKSLGRRFFSVIREAISPTTVFASLISSSNCTTRGDSPRQVARSVLRVPQLVEGDQPVAPRRRFRASSGS